MPDWNSDEELKKDGEAFNHLIHALLGVYIYEWFISLDFDWAYVTGKKKFRWPMIFYFANRYLLLFALIGIVISLDTFSPIDCQGIYTFNQIAGDASVGLASINLALRTIAIWSHNRYVIGTLVLVILGHWTLILQGVQLKAQWVDGGCRIISTNNRILAAIFIYSMVFDLLILLMNTYKLAGLNKGLGAIGNNRLTKMVFEDGLIYFFIAFLANLIATVFMLLGLNPIMTVIFNVPAAIFSTVVACRCVRRLSNFGNDDGSGGGGASFLATGRVVAPRPTTMHPVRTARTNVHVQMETFTHAEEPFDNYENEGKESVRRTDRASSQTDVSEIDIEAKAAL